MVARVPPISPQPLGENDTGRSALSDSLSLAAAFLARCLTGLRMKASTLTLVHKRCKTGLSANRARLPTRLDWRTQSRGGGWLSPEAPKD